MSYLLAKLIYKPIFCLKLILFSPQVFGSLMLMSVSLPLDQSKIQITKGGSLGPAIFISNFPCLIYLASCEDVCQMAWEKNSLQTVFPQVVKSASYLLFHDICIYTTWKVDGATPMYWFIMAPLLIHQTWGLRHLLSLRCTICHI